MELTLTGGSTLGDAPLRRAASSSGGGPAATGGGPQGPQGATTTTATAGASGPSSSPSPSLPQQPRASFHSHSHRGRGHSHAHHAHAHGRGRGGGGRGGGQCCHSPGRGPPRPPKVDASTLLPTEAAVRRFRDDRPFRLGVLSNVVRGGPYALFLNLIAVLAKDPRDGGGSGKGGGKDGDDETRGVENGATKGDDEEEDAQAQEERDEALLKGMDPEVLGRMLDGHGADGHTLAHWCAKRGDEPRFLSFLVSRSHRPNSARLLIDLHRPSRDAVGMYPLHWAVTEGAVPLVSMLLRHLEERPSPPSSSSGSMTLQRVSSTGAASSSSLMRSEGESEDGTAAAGGGGGGGGEGIDARDASGCTPLLIAAQYGHPDLAAFLIRRGADPHAVDSSRDTALHWAAYKGSVEVCGMLLHMMGVEGQLDAQDAFGQTPLHLASLRGNAEAVQFLMEEAAGVGSGTTSGGLESPMGRVGSKLAGRGGRMSFAYPGKLLSMHDKEEKTPRDLAIKKKKVGCEILLLEYEERYLAPKRSVLSRIGRMCRDLFSLRSWVAWMGMGGADMPVGQSPTFPFYWMTGHIVIAGVIYATDFLGIGGRGPVGNDAFLWDKMGLHLFFVVSWFLTWGNLYLVYKTNPGVLDARRENVSTASPATCQLFCIGGGGGYKNDRVSVEMDAVTRELRNRYDEIIESFGREFPSPEERVPLCHTCRIVKPLRSKHCRVARRCVLMFDHHCPFVGTTIGLYNYMYFYLFLVTFSMAEFGFLGAWVTVLMRSKEFPKGTFALGAYFAMYLAPVFFMACYHTQLVFSNLSTNENINARKYRYLWGEDGRFHNQFDQGKIRNALQRCWPDRSSYELGGMARGSEVELVRQEDEERQPILSNIV